MRKRGTDTQESKKQKQRKSKKKTKHTHTPKAKEEMASALVLGSAVPPFSFLSLPLTARA
jgi:hypothetical protein